eukprot:scaffold3437_cov145-Skeletonema_menzelii.AAC.5
MTTPRRIPELNDAQKGDLSLLWERHAPRQALSVGGGNETAPPSGGRGGRGRGRGGRGGRGGGGGGNKGIAPTTIVTMPLEDEDYEFICRLYSFIRSCIDRTEQQDIMQQQNYDHRKTWQSLSFLFQRIKHPGNNASTFITAKITGGNQIVTFDNKSFLQEFNSHEGNHSYPFGTYLHQYPDRALASLGCAIGLNILTLWRRHQSLLPSATNPLQQHNNNQHPNLLTLDTAIYRPRFYNLSSSSQIRMANIRTSTVGCLVSLRGTVTKARPKRLRVLDAGFVCTKCGLHQITQFLDGKYSTPVRCADIKCRSQKFVLNRKVANFCDVQELKIQEVREEFVEGMENSTDQGSNPDEGRDAGRAPRHMEVEVSNDLVDQCHAGDSIVVVGIVRAVNSALASGRVGKRAEETSTYKLYVVGHSIVNLTSEDGSNRDQGRGSKRYGNEFDTGDGKDGNKRQKSSSSSNMQYSDQQLQQIANLAHADHRMYSMPTRMAFPFDLLVRSLCPNIIGNDLVKAGIILCLLGGTPPEVSGLEARSGMTIRSNSHLLIVGDPGMGKSQMLLSANQVAARSVYVGGNTASSRGLTVSLTKESGGDMGIEAGALVLADRGVCCLDELDKMPKTHQDGLLEAMEQQQVSIAKAGVVASLPSRCSVIAAANPKSGHYNMSKSVAENLSMNGPLLSRFDLVFILRDEADSDRDRMISGSIMGRVRQGDPQRDNHQSKHIDGRMARANLIPMQHRLPWVNDFQKQPLPMQQVKDYIAYAREYCRPKMTDAAAEVLSDYFMKLRHPGMNESKKDNVPITTRQLEALIRLSQARAKACLRPYVLKEDAEDVVELMCHSVNQVHMDESGRVDKARGGAGGKSKQRKAFLQAMRDSGQHEFLYSDLQRIADRLSLPVGGFKDFVEDIREAGEIQRTYNGSTTIYKLY